ncbi:hypothetical protein [Devosia salina]|uniref:Uncharacterized protein n=1 Tax=Devosia salina TaxID=2860336 RepID=A0ABX8WCV5_9HYPH|nr:hypothetical protein [Devosia salina]QYO75811.1 hypothetical protein K1X15_14390 [Devosia salina]
MRDRYYRISSPAELPQGSVLVHIWREDGDPLASMEGDEELVVAAPDLILFRAALLRYRHNLNATFVHLENPELWQAGWGDLVDYRGGRSSKRPAPHEAPAGKIEPDRMDAWDYTLNLNSITSPSLTT